MSNNKIKPVSASNTPAPATDPQDAAKSNSQKIWEEIQFLPIELFGLPNQVVSQYCEHLPFAVSPDSLYLTIKSSAVLPALETTLNSFTEALKMQAKRGSPMEVKQYSLELVDKYVVVSRAVNKFPQFPFNK